MRDLQAVIDDGDGDTLATDAVAVQAIHVQIVAGYRQRVGRYRLPGIAQVPLDARQRIGLLGLCGDGQAAQHQGSGKGQPRGARTAGRNCPIATSQTRDNEEPPTSSQQQSADVPIPSQTLMPAGNDDGVGSHLGDANPGWHPHPRMARIYPASSRALTSACATTALAHFRTGAPRCLLNPIPFGFFVGALIFDAIYLNSAEVMWGKAAAWLITFGLLIAIVPRLINLFAVWRRNGTATRIDRIDFFLNLVAVLLAIWNAFVHSRDAYAVAVPGTILSALTVALIALGLILLSLQPPVLQGGRHG
ncbi:hypothetical protein G6F31_015124 [Rhizopus arrhizus]|nr:hypothetical protein G6F31_015124 [Rhizopus arrhizus]